MSVAGYLGPDRAGRRVPDQRERQQGEEVAAKLGRLDGEMLPGGVKRAGQQDEFHDSVESYDAVLRSHCRLR
jgi:hypothetical protein